MICPLAAYCRAGDLYRFYELNPQMRRIAFEQFGFLGACTERGGRVEVIPGDARLLLEAELEDGTTPGYDVLVLNACSSDAAPVHLLTAEAVYLRQFRPDGTIVAHVNRATLPSMAAPVPMPTPLPTKVVLLATLAVAAAALGGFIAARSDPVDTGDSAPYLYLFTGLFLLRVAGQVFVRRRRPRWLPPTEQWNLTPYHLLLPTQVGILAVMGWIDFDFARSAGFWATPRPALGTAVLWFALVYASAMAVRYVARMSRRPADRWFGGTIPIVFHWVLASYLFVFGSFHASH